ncbi:MAG TPA: hypothetical protein VKA46_30875, partial [Gemmataceae bacterium]|nr:hypothetical protein [Gemmataceae bacterium]
RGPGRQDAGAPGARGAGGPRQAAGRRRSAFLGAGRDPATGSAGEPGLPAERLPAPAPSCPTGDTCTTSTKNNVSSTLQTGAGEALILAGLVPTVVTLANGNEIVAGLPAGMTEATYAVDVDAGGSGTWTIDLLEGPVTGAIATGGAV